MRIGSQPSCEEEAATTPRANGRRRQALTKAGGVKGVGGEEGEEGGEDDLMWSARWRSAHLTLLLWLSISGSVKQNAGPGYAQSGTHWPGGLMDRWFGVSWTLVRSHPFAVNPIKSHFVFTTNQSSLSLAFTCKIRLCFCIHPSQCPCNAISDSRHVSPIFTDPPIWKFPSHGGVLLPVKCAGKQTLLPG
jgi:hypothetical protein